MHRVRTFIQFTIALLLFFFSWAVFYADGRLLNHPIATWSFFIGMASAFASVYTRLKGRACLVGFAALAFTAVLYNVVQGAPLFATPLLLLLLVVASVLPFGAGYLVGYWLAMGRKIIVHKVRARRSRHVTPT